MLAILALFQAPSSGLLRQITYEALCILTCNLELVSPFLVLKKNIPQKYKNTPSLIENCIKGYQYYGALGWQNPWSGTAG